MEANKELQLGYYRVKHNGEWRIAQYFDGYWGFPAIETIFYTEEFEEINYSPINAHPLDQTNPKDVLQKHLGNIIAKVVNGKRDDAATLAAMEEYANAKLHLLQQELDGHKEWAEDYKILVREIAVALNGDDAAKQPSLCDLVSPIKKLANEHATLQQEYDRHLAFSEQQAVKINEMRQHRDNMQRQVEKLQQEYDKLKEEHDIELKINLRLSERVYYLKQEHAALNEKAEKMETALGSIASSPIPANEWENFSWIETARQLSSAALSSYNSQTNNQNENNDTPNHNVRG